MVRRVFHLVLICLLTLITQLGGLAWLLALFFRRRLIAFLLAYTALSGAAVIIAPQFGRTALPCFTSEQMRMHSVIYCALNRHYVSPELRDVLTDTATEVADQYPGTITLVLDASFPFINGFPLLPHLSHKNGRAADIAFYYQNDGTYLPGKTRSPIGYFAFEDGPTNCPQATLTLRWNAHALQSLWPQWTLERKRTRTALRALASNPRVGKIFIEPHLKSRLQIRDGKIRFQGCRAARHDDHIHVQL